MKKFFLSVTLAMVAWSATAQSKSLLNLEKPGVAIQGYDPVAFFTDNRPVKGDPKFVSMQDGATYRFASQEHKALFDANPMKYEPSFGGYCAYGVSHSKLVDVDVDAFQIVNGKLLLQHSKSVRDDFNRDVNGNLGKANANWPALVKKKGH